jgi:acetylcholinesterase
MRVRVMCYYNFQEPKLMVMNKGTVFVDPTQNYTTDLVRNNLFTNFSTPFLETFEKNKLNRAVERILELYPDDPSLGSPFGTGNNTFGLSPGFKRISAISKSLLFLKLFKIEPSS